MTSNDSELEVYNLMIGIAGSVCAPIVFALLAVMVCAFRAYKTTFQQSILYQILIALLCECSYAFQVQIDLTLLIQDGCVSLPCTFIYTASSLGLHAQQL